MPQELKGKSIGNKNLKVADVISRSFEKNIRSAAVLDQQTGETALDGVNAGVSINGIEDGEMNEGDKNGSTVDGSVSRARMLVSSGGFDDAVVTGEYKSLAEAFAEGATANSPSLPLTALVVQDHQGISNVAPAYAPLRQLPISKPGDPYLEDQNM
ncbi:Zinc finger CCCH domain-containing protein 24 [Morella rubra]|uniref:Zinc finger CCCH domain-containing protein 24 n=1 Tax=Morella rubra TaxID=262757 RepID=A0A6A1VNL6_9ROSI|nr:Zinc finger CCCH domain-containing protein 24 [Morella rubra]